MTAFTPYFLVVFTAAVANLPAAAQAAPPWSPGTFYPTGAAASYQGLNYQCRQAHTAIPSWEPPNVLALWLPATTSPTQCTTRPGAPQALSASGTTASQTNLTWAAPALPAGCSVTSYTISRNGAAIGTATTPAFTAAGLTPQTTYTFTVTAATAAGAGAPSAPLSVITSASSGNCAPAWSPNAVYTGGMTASVNGTNYKANWWTQNQSPATNSGPTGSGMPWTASGTCAPCLAVPGTPSGLTASGTTAYSTNLSWQPATIPANCALTQYTILRNGVAVGTSATPTFTAAGLTPQTTYTFTVLATDAAGNSAPSPSLTVTTAAAPPGASAKLYAPYIDLNLTNSQQLLTIAQQSGVKAFTLAFILSGGACSPTWGGTTPVSNDLLSNGTSIQSLINGFRATGGDVIISFGGANGTELALACATPAALQSAYQAVINRYGATKLDFDIEGAATTDIASVRRRNQALVALRAANPGLQISFTLPVLPTGLVNSGVDILNAIKADGLAVDVINVMAMDYGPAVDNGGQMGLNATLAATATRAQIQAAGLTASVGITPMIGVNDVATEIFQLSDAQTLLNFANANPYVTRLAIWSISRDNGSCAGNPWASAECSGVAQANYQFSSILKAFQ
jgi:chitinase